MAPEHQRRQAHETGTPSSTRRQTTPAIDGAASGARSDRASRFLSRLDEHLRMLADDAARRAFLFRQQAGWEHRYARFVATDGASEVAASPADPPQAADFLITITGLAARRIALDERGHTARHEGVDERIARHEGIEERTDASRAMDIRAETPVFAG